MNINNLQDGSHGTLAEYLAVAIPLTAITIWVIMALHSSKARMEESDKGFIHRLRWPITELLQTWKRKRMRGNANNVGVV